ncbi:MAG TPA: PAS domain S-box protein [Pyrinomonadaceae bacterium]|nr:PAS domain S-box protein [Pyrinomonadaceae bacterium]
MPRFSSLSRYAVVFASVGLALLVTSQVDLLARRTPFALFFAAVMFSAWFGGYWMGLLAIALSVPLTDYFIVSPTYSLRFGSINLVEEGAFVGVALLLVTLTSARQRSEKSLWRSNERYRIITETASDAIITIDESSKILFANQAAERIFGYSIPEMLGHDLTMLMPEGLRHLHRTGIRRYLDTGQKHLNWSSIDVPGRHKDGREISLELSFGEFVGERERNFTGIVRDITERKRAEEERERFFVVSADLLVIAGFDGQFKWVSPAWERALGWTSAELTAHPWLHFVHPDDQERTIKEGERIFHGAEVIAFENRYRHKNGSYHWISWRSRPYMAEQLIYGSATDITEQKHLEDQLRQAQKLESIGQLAGGVAHDFNNVLTVIMGHAEVGLPRLPEDHAVRNNLQEIVNAAERAATLTRQLLAFSRKQVLEPEIVDINRSVRETEKMLQRLIGEHIELVTLLDPEPGRVMADRSQLEQVLLNLAVNARDAMPRGGKLIIETKSVLLDEDYTRRHVHVQPGRYVMLAVSDTGMGMSSETMQHIFEPFFTTKESGKGTGLGLSMVYGIVKQSGGNIWVYSEPEHGTTFKIYLPLTSHKGEETQASTVELPRQRGTETILLVEDEAGIRNLLQDVLQTEGYTVLAAATGQEALNVCSSYGPQIHLLITDVIMPGMSGRELVDRLLGKGRDIKVLYMSGYTNDAIVNHGVLDPGINFLQKPFTPRNVAAKVREVLEAAAEQNT